MGSRHHDSIYLARAYHDSSQQAHCIALFGKVLAETLQLGLERAALGPTCCA